MTKQAKSPACVTWHKRFMSCLVAVAAAGGDEAAEEEAGVSYSCTLAADKPIVIEAVGAEESEEEEEDEEFVDEPVQVHNI